MYCYIVEGSSLIELTSDLIPKYDKKKVRMRFSSMCEAKGCICNKCAGNLYTRLGISNVGMATPIAASTLKNLSMKSFHQSQVIMVEMDPLKAFL